MNIHTQTVDTAKKDMENSKQASKAGNVFIGWAQSSPSLLMDINFTGVPSAHCLTALQPRPALNNTLNKN